MALGPIAEIAIGWGRPTYVPRDPFHGGVGSAIGWRQPATIAAFLRKKRGDFFQTPNVIRNSRFHRGSNAQAAMDAAEVVVHEVKDNQVLQEFAEKSSH
jgi:hypothetical protein